MRRVLSVLYVYSSSLEERAVDYGLARAATTSTVAAKSCSQLFCTESSTYKNTTEYLITTTEEQRVRT